MNRSLNHFADGWWQWQAEVLVQVSLLILFVLMVDLCIRRWAWPRLRHALWLLVLLKLLLPPGLTSPVSLVGRFWPREEASPLLEAMEKPKAPVIATPSPTVALPTKPLRPVPAVAPAPFPVRPPRTPLSWKVWPMAVWALGVTGLFVWLVLRLRRFRRDLDLAVSDQPTPEWLDRVLHEAASQLKLRRVPLVQISHATASPAVFGLFRPVVLLPASETHTLSEVEGRHILLHELAHVKRGDLFLHALHMVLLILYWFNPLLWAVRRFFQNLRELCCDATVANALRQDVPAYRETLLNTARRLLAQTPPTSLGLLGWFENSRWLGIRLRWLQRNTWKRRWLQVSATLVLVLAIAGCVLPMGRRTLAETNYPLATLEARQVLAEYGKHRDEAPKRYVLATKTKYGVTVMCRNGQRFSLMSYPLGTAGNAQRRSEEAAERDRQEAGDSLTSILKWATKRAPRVFHISDGKYKRSGQRDGFGHLVVGGKRPARRATDYGAIQYTLRYLSWPAFSRRASTTAIRLVKDDAYAQSKGLFCLESRETMRLLGKERERLVRHYLDPSKGYIRQRIDEPAARFRAEITAFSQTGTDDFVPTEIRQTGIEGPQGLLSPIDMARTTQVFFDANAVFPPETFDLDALERKHGPFRQPTLAGSTIDTALRSRSLAQVNGTVVAGDTGQPVANALIRLATPATDMRNTRGRNESGSEIFETHSDANGRFTIRFPANGRSFALDAFSPGFRTVAGTRSSGGDPQQGPIVKGQVWELDLRLHRARYVAGNVVDQEGRPRSGVEVSGRLVGNGTFFIATTFTDAKGHFELFDYFLQPWHPEQRGELVFTHPETVTQTVRNIYQMDDQSLASLTVRMGSGLTVQGTLLHADGTPAAATDVLACEDEWSRLRRGTTDDAGQFRLQALPAGKVTLHAYGKRPRENVCRSIDLTGHDQDVTLRMQVRPLPKDLKTFDLLGIQVADVTPELQQVYDLPMPFGIVVIVPGNDYKRLGIDALAEGDQIWHIGGKKSRNTKDAVSQILATAIPPTGGWAAPNPVPVIITKGWHERNKPELTLSAPDIIALRALSGVSQQSPVLPPIGQK